MSNRRTFLKNISLLTLGGLASQSVLASNKSAEFLVSADSVSNNAAKNKWDCKRIL